MRPGNPSKGKPGRGQVSGKQKVVAWHSVLCLIFLFGYLKKDKRKLHLLFPLLDGQEPLLCPWPRAWRMSLPRVDHGGPRGHCGCHVTETGILRSGNLHPSCVRARPQEWVLPRGSVSRGREGPLSVLRRREGKDASPGSDPSLAGPSVPCCPPHPAL